MAHRSCPEHDAKQLSPSTAGYDCLGAEPLRPSSCRPAQAGHGPILEEGLARALRVCLGLDEVDHLVRCHPVLEGVHVLVRCRSVLEGVDHLVQSPAEVGRARAWLAPLAAAASPLVCGAEHTQPLVFLQNAVLARAQQRRQVSESRWIGHKCRPFG